MLLTFTGSLFKIITPDLLEIDLYGLDGKPRRVTCLLLNLSLYCSGSDPGKADLEKKYVENLLKEPGFIVMTNKIIKNNFPLTGALDSCCCTIMLENGKLLEELIKSYHLLIKNYAT